MSTTSAGVSTDKQTSEDQTDIDNKFSMVCLLTNSQSSQNN